MVWLFNQLCECAWDVCVCESVSESVTDLSSEVKQSFIVISATYSTAQSGDEMASPSDQRDHIHNTDTQQHIQSDGPNALKTRIIDTFCSNRRNMVKR